VARASQLATASTGAVVPQDAQDGERNRAGMALVVAWVVMTLVDTAALPAAAWRGCSSPYGSSDGRRPAGRTPLLAGGALASVARPHVGGGRRGASGGRRARGGGRRPTGGGRRPGAGRGRGRATAALLAVTLVVLVGVAVPLLAPRAGGGRRDGGGGLRSHRR
jgi:hypothetical protein